MLRGKQGENCGFELSNDYIKKKKKNRVVIVGVRGDKEDKYMLIGKYNKNK